jgi:hypothetical protein
VYPITGARVSGELLAVGRDTVWLLSGGTLIAIGAGGIRAIDVERHRFGGSKTIAWMTLAGVGTGTALLWSCASYGARENDNSVSCGGVLPGTLLAFLAAGALLSFSNQRSSRHHLSPVETERLRPLARFPQGLPDSLAAVIVPRAP